MLSAGGGCELAAVTRCKCAWDKFCRLLPFLTNSNLLLVARGRKYSTCVRSVMLHAAETWVMTAATLDRLRRNDRVRFFQKISKGQNSTMGDNVIRKIWVSYFLMRYPYIKFQESSCNRTKDTICIRKTVADGRTDESKAICPSNFSKLGVGIKSIKIFASFFSQIFTKDHNSTIGDNWLQKKYRLAIFI